MKTLGIGLIGCGGVAQRHMQLISAMQGVELRAVCDNRPERAQAAADKYGAQPYTDYRELIKRTDLDVVHICTPHYLHAQMAIDALDAGRWVLCEKPMASEVADAKEMIRHAKGRLGITFQNRYNKSAVMAKAIIDDAPMGALTHLRGMVSWHRTPEYYTQSGWRGSKVTEGGGVLINQAIHTLDLMLWLGGAAERVSGAVSTDLLDGVIEVEDMAHFSIQYEDGKRGVFFGTTGNAHDAPVEIELTFEKGSLLIKGDVLTQRTDSGERQLFAPEQELSWDKPYWGDGHGALFVDFYECVRDNRPFWIDGEEALGALVALKSVYRSSEERRPVFIKEWED